MGPTAMADEVVRQQQDPTTVPVAFEERFGWVVEAEWIARANRPWARRLRDAHLRVSATPEAIDYGAPRQWNATLVRQLAQGLWVAHHQTVLITGPTGVGKPCVLCALGHAACRRNFRVRYYRMPRLLADSLTAKQRGTWFAWIRALQRLDLLLLDDWGLYPITLDESRDLLELIDSRYEQRATAIASQLPVEQWYPWVPDATVADAVLDRLVHHAHRLTIHGESLRKVLPTSSIQATTEPEATDA
ncbi:MAG: IS21-like element helper ATPase IstB [Firmicutes bacterium]|nr:ATP-binding protein [Alicyclobacillaceae bacterium]MCL6497794.1 IS21-like element helper ATPase IstB [Bacillota bacterium]